MDEVRDQGRPLEGLGFGVGGRYYTDQAGDLPNTFELPTFGIFDLAAFYTRGPVRLQVNVNNVLDTRYFATAFSREYVLPGEPLSVTASADLEVRRQVTVRGPGAPRRASPASCRAARPWPRPGA